MNLTKTVALAICLGCTAMSASSVKADIIDIDISNVDPAAQPVILAAEAAIEARIQFYSSEIPRVIRDQLSSIKLAATVAPIDGAGGTLAQAGPTAILTLSHEDPTSPFTRDRPWAVAVAGDITFDLDDFPALQADGILQSTVEHEMLHALGFGTLFELNNLAAPLGGIGLTQYTGGKYALPLFRQETGNPLVSFVPLEQRGGPGTALGHWVDLPPFFNQVFTDAFTKELMTGFAGDIDPNSGQIVFAPTFVSQATYGALADLGFAVIGVNGHLAVPKGSGTGSWPKITGFGTDPFAANGVGSGAGLGFKVVTLKAAYKASLNSEGSGASDVETDTTADPYNLRSHRWVK
ncbi:MAG: hypothetical protein AB8B55_12730 [Mariniblastus sp.]